MPIFEFTCAECGHVFEELLSHQELAAGRVSCPGCGSPEVERGFSAFNQGSGGSPSVGPACGVPGGGCGSGGFG